MTSVDFNASVERLRMLEKAERNVVDEVVFVCAAPADLVLDIIVTLRDHDDVIAAAIADPEEEHGIWTMEMASRGPRTGQRD